MCRDAIRTVPRGELPRPVSGRAETAHPLHGFGACGGFTHGTLLRPPRGEADSWLTLSIREFLDEWNEELAA